MPARDTGRSAGRSVASGASRSVSQGASPSFALLADRPLRPAGARPRPGGRNGPPTTVNGTAVPLADAATRLLAGRIDFRDHVATGKPATVEVSCFEYPCYSCDATSLIWEVNRETIQGPCGTTGEIRHASIWAGPPRSPGRRTSPCGRWRPIVWTNQSLTLVVASAPPPGG